MATLQGDRMLLVVDSDVGHGRFVAALAARAGWRTMVVADVADAVASLGTHDGLLIDAVLLDGHSARASLANLIDTMHQWRPSLPIIYMGETGRRAGALHALRAGASDIIDRPLTAERLSVALDNAISPNFPAELRSLSEKFPAALPIEEIIGSTPAFRTALAIAAKIARARVAVHISGEAGSGKSLLAHAVHAAGNRGRAPFVEMDCAHFSQAMLGPQLFGHERGAFAGAFERRTGDIARADGGTLVIDRIERLPLDVQAALATFLENGIVTPVGGGAASHVDVRLIAMSEVDLAARAADGLFREDLLARIAIAEIRLPPLRERRADIAPLARHFAARIAAMPDMDSLTLSPDLVDALTAWRWSGNVRQLFDAILRAACTATGPQLRLSDFTGLQSERAREPDLLRHAAPMPGDGIGVTLYRPDGNLRPLEEIEADVIRLAIGHYRGRMSEVARRLGIGRSTLYRKLSDLGIDTAA